MGIDGCIKKIYSYALFHCWETVGIYGCDKKKRVLGVAALGS